MGHRILFCTLGYEPGPVGGAERQARLQAEELVRRGHSVEVVTPRPPGTTSEWIEGVRVHRLRRVERRPFRTITYLPVLFAWLLARGSRYDLFHVHLANLQADVAGVVSRFLRIPTYVKVATGGPKGEIARMRRVSWATHFVGLRSAARIQAISSEIEADLAALGIPSNRVVQIPNGLRTDVYHPVSGEARADLRRRLDLPMDDVLVLYAGRFARYKGILDLLEAWSTVPLSVPATLVIVGEAALDAPVGPLPATQRTIVRPWTPAIVDYFQAVDVYVHPSHADGMPNVVLEAMACGLAVVATRIAAIPSMIDHGVTGRLVDPGSIDQLRAEIVSLIDDPAARQALGVRAAARIAATYPIARIVDQIEDAYRGFLGESPAGSR